MSTLKTDDGTVVDWDCDVVEVRCSCGSEEFTYLSINRHDSDDAVCDSCGNRFFVELYRTLSVYVNGNYEGRV